MVSSVEAGGERLVDRAYSFPTSSPRRRQEERIDDSMLSASRVRPVFVVHIQVSMGHAKHLTARDAFVTCDMSP